MNKLLGREMIRLMLSQLQVGEDAPTYIIRLRKPDEFYLPPKILTVPTGGVVSIDVSGSREFGSKNATVVLEDAYGLKSPEFGPEKHSSKSEMIAEVTPNDKQQFFFHLLQPETWIQICLGYGEIVVPVLTGAIDRSEINAQETKITLSVRDNMRYLIDQTIDAMLHGKKLIYPRQDSLVVISEGTKAQTSTNIQYVKIKDVSTYLNVRTGPGTNHDAIGKAYNGQIFQYLGDGTSIYNNTWYKIKFNGEDRWIYSGYATIIHSNETVKTNSVVRVDKIKNVAGNYLNVRSGPGTNYSDIGNVYFGDVLEFLGREKSIYGNWWFHIRYSGGDGWVYGGYASVEEGTDSDTENSWQIQAKDFHNFLDVKQDPDAGSATVGQIYDGNSYTFLESYKDGSGNWWHKIEFKMDDGTKQGWIDDGVASLEQEAHVLSYHTIATVVNVTTHLHVRSGPSTNYPILKEVPNGTVLSYLGSVSGSNGNSIWHHILFSGKNGWQEGYVHGDYIKLSSGVKPNHANDPDPVAVDPAIMVDATLTTNPKNEKWTAAAIVHDLAVEALHIYGGNGIPFNLDRSICRVLTSEYNLEENGQVSKYVLDEQEFDTTASYFDAAMFVVNQLGDVSFRCNRYGDIELFRNRIPSQYDQPDWEVHDYVDLTSAELKYNVQDMRNRIIVTSDNGTSLFEHKGITSNICKGVNRTMSIKVPFATTIEKRKEAARSIFQQMWANWRKMTIAIIGNPLIEVGDIIKLDEMVTTATSLFRVIEFRHQFAEQGFITQLELEWIAQVPSYEVTLVTEEFPEYVKRFDYNLVLKANVKPMKIKMANTIQKARVNIRDKNTGEILTTVELVGNVVQQTTPPPTTIEPKKYVLLQKDGVNIRTEANLNANTVKKVKSSGFKMEYLGETDKFYKGKDPEDGGTIYIWRDFCSIIEQTGNPDSRSVSSVGAAQTFIDLVSSKVGCGYVWGAQGETLTSEKLQWFKNTFGASHYDFYESGNHISASKWLGKQVFDCSGLVVWALQKMNLISSNQDYTAQGLFGSLCYEVSKANVKPGDLFFRQDGGNIYHVGVVVNGGQVVEARGTSSGVIQRALPNAERFGRIKKLSDATSYQVPQELQDDTNNVPTTTTPIPTSYTATTTFNVNSAPQAAKDKVQQLHGNLLFYKDDCVLYYVGVESDGGQKNVLVLNWAPLVSTPVNLDLSFEVLMY